MRDARRPCSVVGLVVLGPERGELELGQSQRERRLKAVGDERIAGHPGREPTCPAADRSWRAPAVVVRRAAAFATPPRAEVGCRPPGRVDRSRPSAVDAMRRPPPLPLWTGMSGVSL